MLPPVGGARATPRQELENKMTGPQQTLLARAPSALVRSAWGLPLFPFPLPRFISGAAPEDDPLLRESTPATSSLARIRPTRPSAPALGAKSDRPHRRGRARADRPEMTTPERAQSTPTETTQARSTPTKSLSTPLAGQPSPTGLGIPSFRPVRSNSTRSPLRLSPTSTMADRTDSPATAYGGSKPADALTALAEKGERTLVSIDCDWLLCLADRGWLCGRVD